MSSYVPLWCKSNFSFLEGASHPDELVDEGYRLGLPALALTDRDGVYGGVRAQVKARKLRLMMDRRLSCWRRIAAVMPIFAG
jgi:error-prone DNA polymerase